MFQSPFPALSLVTCCPLLAHGLAQNISLTTVACCVWLSRVSLYVLEKEALSMGRKHREKKMSDKEAEENLTAKLVETGYREQLKKKVSLTWTHSLDIFSAFHIYHLFYFVLVSTLFIYQYQDTFTLLSFSWLRSWRRAAGRSR